VNLLEDINIWQGGVLKESDETITTYLAVFSQASNGTHPDVNIRIVSANMNKDKHMYNKTLNSRFLVILKWALHNIFFAVLLVGAEYGPDTNQ
jgi:hypothetical protein